MTTVIEAALRQQLQERKARLTAHPRLAEAQELQQLLEVVDEALARMDAGAFGVCDVCHEDVEADRLIADPLCTVCLDHLSAEERRRLEHDLELAREVQASLLPRGDAGLKGWEIRSRYLPAGPVSGDYYDVIALDPEPGSALVLLGDISGKGVSASLLMASLHAVFRSLGALGLPLGELLARANRLLCESTPASAYATLVGARIDRAGGIELANAGHCAPLVRHGRQVVALPSDGLPLGMFCSAAYVPRRLSLASGDLLLLYTDGLSEARSPRGEEYGTERIAAVLAASAAVPAEAMLRALLDDVAAFRDGTPAADDLALLALARS